MKLHVKAYFNRTGGVFTLVALAAHWGNRTIGLTLFNVVIELEF